MCILTPIQKADQTVILLEIEGSSTYSMCKVVMWMEDVEKWQLLEINKPCLKIAFILSSVVPTSPTAKLWNVWTILNALETKCSSLNGVVSLQTRGIRGSLGKKSSWICKMELLLSCLSHSFRSPFSTNDLLWIHFYIHCAFFVFYSKVLICIESGDERIALYCSEGKPYILKN